VLLLAVLSALVAHPASAKQQSVSELTAQVESLSRQLEEASTQLAAAKARQTAAENELADAATSADKGIQLGPVTIGGAMRINYIYGDYSKIGDAPQRGGNGGNVELDTFRINASLNYQQFIGRFEYRWYNGYNFLHTGWLGYAFEDGAQLEVGVTRVPFGPGPYGVSQSWFFGQHYYVGLADDMDLGVKYLTEIGRWDLAFAYFYSSEGNWNGASEDSARYSYDAVKWRSGIEANGDIVESAVNGYDERNQFNFRAIYQFGSGAKTTDIGASFEWGELDGQRADDGEHWAVSGHMVNKLGNLTLALQLTRYEMHIDDHALAVDNLIALGAYDFAWPAATKAWIPAISISYQYDTPQLSWLDFVKPYLEYSNIVKDDNEQNNSSLAILGAAWASGGWYIYSDFAYSNGNLFVGNEGDNYTNIYDGVGDFGANGNDKWNYRFNINFGYYY
jgi:hypothetical protein